MTIYLVYTFKMFVGHLKRLLDEHLTEQFV